MIAITQKDREILQRIRNFSEDGRIYPCNKGKYKLYQFRLTGKKTCLTFLQKITGSLLLKKEPAEIVIQFCKLPSKKSFLNWHTIWAEQLKLLASLMKFNTRRKWGTIKLEEVRKAVESYERIPKVTKQDLMNARKTMSIREVAKIYGVAPNTVCRWLN